MSRQIYIFVLLVFAAFYVVWGLIVPFPDFGDLRFVGTIGLIQFVFSVYSSIKNGQRLISPYVMFLIVMFVFQTGQSLMYPFGIVTKRDLLGFYDIGISDIFNAQLVSFSFLAFFQIGSLLCKPDKNREPLSVKCFLTQNRRLLTIGWILAIVSAYPYYKELTDNAILSLTKGYGAIYAQEVKVGLDNLQSVIADYFMPSMICLYIGYRKSKLKRLIIFWLLMFNCATLLVTGGRSEAVIILALILILHNYLVKKFTIKKIVLIGVAGFFVLGVLTNIAKLRGSSSRNIEETFQVDGKTSDNGVAEAISEMGGSMFCQIWTKQILDRTDDYRYGSSYLYAFTTIIPNLGFWKIHPAKEHANLGDWLTKEKRLHFGTGFSTVAEAYVNFGYFGALFMILLGYVATLLFGRLYESIRNRDVAFTALILVIFWFSLKIPRNSFIGLVRAVFYFGLPIYWFTRGYIFKINND